MLKRKMRTDTHDQIENGPAKRSQAGARRMIADTALLSAADYPNITRVEVSGDYRKRQNVTQLAFALFLLHTIRKFETLLLGLNEQRLIHGPLHSSIGQLLWRPRAVLIFPASAVSIADRAPGCRWRRKTDNDKRTALGRC